MQIDILTTFPGIIEPVIAESILGRARDRGSVSVNAINLRNYTTDRHRSTDDEPYGGGPGMVMKCEPVFAAVKACTKSSTNAKVLLMTPQGVRFSQSIAEQLARETQLVIICGRYEGVDERIREHLVTDEISIGDYILNGGEIAALVVVEAVVRLLPGVLGDDASSVSESFSSGLLEYPHYTRPTNYGGWNVPEVLLSGNHAKIAEWKRRASLERTSKRRPDLLESAELTLQDRQTLDQIALSIESNQNTDKQ